MQQENILSCGIGNDSQQEELNGSAVKANKLEAEHIGEDLNKHSAMGEDPYMILRRAEAIRVPNSADDKHLHKTISDNLHDLPKVRDHIQQVLESHHNVAEHTGNDILARTLTAKYGWALGHGQKTPIHDYGVDEMYIPKEHILKHTDDYNFMGGRYLRHKKLNSIHRLENDGSLSPAAHLNSSERYFSVGMNPLVNEATTQSLKFHHENLSDIHEPHIDNNVSHKNAVHSYTADSGEINRLTAAQNQNKEPRGDFEDIENTKHIAGKIREAIHSAPKYETPMTVYTGISKSTDPAKGVPTETQGKARSTFKAFTSTSLDPSTALGFAHMGRTDTHKDTSIKQPISDIVELKVPPKSSGLYMESHTMNPAEFEYLLPDNTHIEHDTEPKYFAKDGVIFRHWKGKVV